MWCILVIRSSFYTRTQAKVISYSSIPIVLIYENVITDKIKKSFTSDQRFITILTLLAIVSFTTLSYADYAFAQNQTDTDGKTIESDTKAITPELERMTFRVFFDGNDCTSSEKFDIISLSKCEMIKGIPHMTISILPEHVADLFNMDSRILLDKPDYFKTDMPLVYERVKYLVQKNNVISERALGNDVKDAEDKIVRVVVAVEKDQCTFPDDLNIRLIDTNCSTISEDFFKYDYQVAVNIPISKLQELEQLDYVISIDHDYILDEFEVQEPYEIEVVPQPYDEELSLIPSDKDTSAKLITMESNSNMIYGVILIGIVVTSTIFVIFLRCRKRIKIEA